MCLPSGIFWRCKIDEILIILPFTLGCPYDTAYLVFSSKVFAKHGVASVLYLVVSYSFKAFDIIINNPLFLVTKTTLKH